jgi:hypothetical protein
MLHPYGGTSPLTLVIISVAAGSELPPGKQAKADFFGLN